MNDNKLNQDNQEQACTTCGVAYQDNSGVKTPSCDCRLHSESRGENKDSEKNSNNEKLATSLHASCSCC